MRRRGAVGLFALALVLFGLGAGRDAFDRWVLATPLPPLTAETSVEVLDRNGELLRPFLVADGRWRLAVRLDEVDPAYVEMLVRYEDKRFWRHSGVDVIAMGRAVAQALRSGRVVSGGSTLTMQVARLLEDGTTGQMDGKLRQLRLALALERHLTKEEILTLYMNRAPFGGNIEGVRAASYAWLGKPPRRLTPAQAALLVALPQSPERRRPDRDPEAAQAARDRVLMRMARDGVLPPAEVEAALTEGSPQGRNAFPALAAHLAGRLAEEAPDVGVHRTTLDAGLQAGLEALAAEAARQAGARMQVALIVADHRTGEVLAQVGSAGYGDARDGFVDMTRALRSPGSTLKPLIYGLAFDRGLAHPETLIADRPVSYDGYAPRNFDGLFRGELRVRQALQLSLNVPAVALLEALGPQHLLTALRRAGAEPALPEGGAPGLAVALGGVGLTLEDLVRAYAAVANGGQAVDLRTGAARDGFAARALMGRAAAWQLADILRDAPRPEGVLGEGIAFKTGTSYGYRDAWALGFDGAHVVGVWMGRPDGTPVPGLSGVTRAAPALFRVFEHLGAVAPLPPPPPETLLVSGARLPQALRRFGGAGTVGQPAVRIAFPPDGAVVEGTGLTVKLRDGRAPFAVLANGVPVARGHAREVEIDELGRGFSTVTVIDADGRAARVSVEMR
jgi:penicillin-binding protein 1C